MGILFPTLLGDLVALIITVTALIIIYFQYAYTYWARKGVPYIQPKFPLGNLKTFIVKSYVVGSDSASFYKELKSKGHKFGGIFTLCRPVLVLTDPDYVRDIMTKDFHNFIARGGYHIDEDPLSNHLFNVGEKTWKGIRSRLTPTFTTGKMKMMFHTVVECSKYMDEYLSQKAAVNENIDILDVVASFTTDVIGACAFGINCNSFKGTEGEFRAMGREIFIKRTLWSKIKTLLAGTIPELAMKLKLTVVREDVSNFFFGTVQNTIKYRNQNNVTRPDFLQLLINIQKEDPNFTMNDLVAQVFLFFVAGYDTSAATMTFTIFELCKNPDIQERVREEILEVLEKNNNEITYESLNEMKYLGQVIDEALRMYPPVQTLTRTCTKDYTLRDTNIIIQRGTPVYIPLCGFHMDPEYYPEPEKFDPDRFSPENKALRHPYVHLPFGEGPRNCIGLRFGVMQSRLGLVRILKDYRLSLSPDTKVPLTFDGTFFLVRSNETILVKAQKIKS